MKNSIKNKKKFLNPALFNISTLGTATPLEIEKTIAAEPELLPDDTLELSVVFKPAKEWGNKK